MTAPIAPPDTQTVQTNPNATTLIIGDGGSGKSSLLATLAEYVWETYKLWTSYALCDGGGVPTQVQALANMGIIKLWRMRMRRGTAESGDLTLETIHRASEGYLPRRFNPRTGECDPAVELVAPTTSVIHVLCVCGQLAQTVTHQASIAAQAICTACGQPVNSQTRITRRAVSITKGFEKRGAAVFDGVTSAGDWALDALSMLNLGGENTRLGGRVQSGGMQFGENNRGQVGFAQTRSAQWLQNGAGIPGLVVPAVWTALIAEGLEEGLRIKGPKLPGQAKTTMAPQWVGNLLEAAAELDAEGRPVRRLYIKSFVDKDGIKHLLKPRAYPALLPPFLEDPDTDDPKQARFEQFNLGYFFKLMDAARVQNEQMMAAKHPDAPGSVESEEFGGGEGPAALTPAQPTISGPRAVPKGPRAAAPGVPRARAGASVNVVVNTRTTPTTVTTPEGLSVTVPAGLTGRFENTSDTPALSPDHTITVVEAAPPPVSPTTPQAAAPPAPRPPMRSPVAAPAGRRPMAVGQPNRPVPVVTPTQ